MDASIVPAYIISIIINISLPILLFFFLNRKLNIGWKMFLYGAGLFLLFRIPLGFILDLIYTPLTLSLLLSMPEALSLALFIVALVLGILGGLFEGIGRYVGFRFTKKFRGWKNALMFGTGWVTVETVFFVIFIIMELSTLMWILDIGTEQYITLLGETGYFTEEELLEQLYIIESSSWLDVLPMIITRFSAIILHLSLSIIVMQVFSQKKMLFLLVAIFMSAIVDMASILLNFGTILNSILILVITVVMGYLTVRVSKIDLNELFAKPAAKSSKSKK